MPTRALLFMLLLTAPLAVRADDLVTLLLELNCPECHLADVDLVHADLRTPICSGLNCKGPILARRDWMGLISAMQTCG